MIPPPSNEKRPHDPQRENTGLDGGDDPVSPPHASLSATPDDLSESDFEQYQAGLRCFLKSRLGQDSDVDDCLQNVLLKWLQHRDRVPPPVTRAWLFTVASNESALVWRKRVRNQQVLQSLAEQTDEHTQPPDHVDQRETHEVIRRAVNRLPEDMQAVVRLRLESDATFEQIAEQLNIPLGTALSRMHRALAKLEKELQILS